MLTSVRSPTAEDARVLDVACGDGDLLSLLLARAGASVELFGVDLSKAELGHADSSLGSSAALFLSRAQSLPFGGGIFDYVFCHLALMLMDSADRVLAELHRVLKPGAVLAAVVGTRSPPSPGLTAYINTLSQFAWQPRFAGLRIGDRRFHSRAGIEELLAPLFTDVLIDDVSISRRLTPEELWTWFLSMYDLYLLTDADRSAAEHAFKSAVAPSCGQDGKVSYDQSLVFLSARAS